MKKQELTKKIVEKLEIETYDTLWDIAKSEEKEDKSKNNIVNDYVEDFLDYVNFKPENFNSYDFDRDIARDIASEYADGKINIYHYDIYRHAHIFAEYTDESINKFGVPETKDFTLSRLLQQGEFYFWVGFANEVISIIEDLIEEEEAQSQQEKN